MNVCRLQTLGQLLYDGGASGQRIAGLQKRELPGWILLAPDVTKLDQIGLGVIAFRITSHERVHSGVGRDLHVRAGAVAGV